MGKVRKSEPVKLVCGLILSQDASLETVKAGLSGSFGPIDFETEPSPFDFTRYYREEMGENLKRLFLSFERLINPQRLVEIKLLTNRLEVELGEVVGGELTRGVNIDPGYLESSKLVLASTKNFSHRIYLDKGIFAEVSLIFRQGRFQPLEWTYPDYRTERVEDFLIKVRQKYLSQLRRASFSGEMAGGLPRGRTD